MRSVIQFYDIVFIVFQIQASFNLFQAVAITMKTFEHLTGAELGLLVSVKSIKITKLVIFIGRLYGLSNIHGLNC